MELLQKQFTPRQWLTWRYRDLLLKSLSDVYQWHIALILLRMKDDSKAKVFSLAEFNQFPMALSDLPARICKTLSVED
jgi:hypothetical protein